MAGPAYRRASHTAFGMSISALSLAVLVVENSALILAMHYSRIMPPVHGQRYLTSTAVFMDEVFKLVLSLTMALYEQSRKMSPNAPATTLFRDLSASVFTGDSWKMAIPALLYTLQNSLTYIAISHLDAATYQVTYQLKILATAVFSVTILRRHLDSTKWLSLILLMCGVAIVQLPITWEQSVLTIQDLREGRTGWRLPRTVEEMRDLGNVAAAQLLHKRSATYEGIDDDYAIQVPQLNASLGLFTALAACLCSGLAGVYLEKILKDSATRVSLWTRNVQLSLYSLFPALFIGVMFRDGAQISKTGFFTGYNWVVWVVIVLQAVGGLLVAAVVNYADNIAKNFATSISIILSFLLSFLFFDTSLKTSFILGTAIVLTATYLYSKPHPGLNLPPITTTLHEKGKGSEPGSADSYFDLEHDATANNSAISPSKRTDALSSSRPATPINERRHLRSKSSHEKRARAMTGGQM